jgi:hypothetical protein
MKCNCCQQSSVCPKNKICKPINSLEPKQKPWNCDELIRSCGGYLDRHRESGMYQVVDSVNGSYEVYCHFDSDHVACTLAQSYSFENRSFVQFKKSLSKDIPISENALTWSRYRLSKPRMKSIKNNSIFLQFTCDYEKLTLI